MADNVLERLVAEWYEYSGYVIRRNVKLAKIEKGAHGELDVVGFHARRNHVIHVEASVTRINVETYKRKFELGRKYIATVFDGLSIPDDIEQIALVTEIADTKLILPFWQSVLGT
jgi:hypothetical protein